MARGCQGEVQVANYDSHVRNEWQSTPLQWKILHSLEIIVYCIKDCAQPENWWSFYDCEEHVKIEKYLLKTQAPGCKELCGWVHEMSKVQGF